MAKGLSVRKRVNKPSDSSYTDDVSDHSICQPEESAMNDHQLSLIDTTDEQPRDHRHGDDHADD